MIYFASRDYQYFSIFLCSIMAFKSDLLPEKEIIIK